MDEIKNSVKYLQNNDFSRMELPEQLAIKALGRHMPDLNIFETTKRKNKTVRKFDRTIYDQNDWLTGCAEKNAYFCFQCLLFGNDPTWTKIGVKDPKSAIDEMETHFGTTEHKFSLCKLAMLGQTPDTIRQDEIRKQNIEEHNEEAKKNRKFLSRIINCIVFCGKFELPFERRGEFGDSTKSQVFRSVLKSIEHIDDDIMDTFLDLISNKSLLNVRNEILDCILSVCQDEIRDEINKAAYLAVMTENVTDVSEHVQQAIVFRYVLAGNVHERFWGFFNPSPDPEGLASCIEEQLKIVLDDNRDKLVAQTYNGAAETRSENGCVEKIIQKSYPNANLVHHYGHRLDFVIARAASRNRRVRKFFYGLGKISSYFENSPFRQKKLEEFTLKSDLKWDSCNVGIVFENMTALVQCFEFFEMSRHEASVQGAGLNLFIVHDHDFNFWLKVFYNIMPHVDELYSKIQNCFDSSVVCEAVEEFCKIIDEMKKDDATKEYFLESQKTKYSYECNLAAIMEVCDCIVFEIKERFRFTGHLFVENLLNRHLKISPLDMKGTLKAYPGFKQSLLKTELTVLRRSEDLKTFSGITKLCIFIYVTKVFSALSEVYKLSQIVLTTPIMSTESERCCSTIETMKTFLKNSKEENRLCALAMLSIENEMISNIRDFNEKVMDKLCTKENKEEWDLITYKRYERKFIVG